MYRNEPVLPYAHGLFCIMPIGLPKRFYPEQENRAYKTEHYVICFNEDLSAEMKQRIISDYAKYYSEEMEMGRY